MLAANRALNTILGSRAQGCPCPPARRMHMLWRAGAGRSQQAGPPDRDRQPCRDRWRGDALHGGQVGSPTVSSEASDRHPAAASTPAQTAWLHHGEPLAGYSSLVDSLDPLSKPCYYAAFNPKNNFVCQISF
jgi:hypothetical protein